MDFKYLRDFIRQAQTDNKKTKGLYPEELLAQGMWYTPKGCCLAYINEQVQRRNLEEMELSCACTARCMAY